MALWSRGSPVGRRSVAFAVRFAAAARSTVDCQCTTKTSLLSVLKIYLFRGPVQCFVTPVKRRSNMIIIWHLLCSDSDEQTWGAWYQQRDGSGSICDKWGIDEYTWRVLAEWCQHRFRYSWLVVQSWCWHWAHDRSTSASKCSSLYSASAWPNSGLLVF